MVKAGGSGAVVVGESRGGGVEVAEGVRVEREAVGEEVAGVMICGGCGWGGGEAVEGGVGGVVEIPCNDGEGRGGGVCWEEGGGDEVLAVPMARGREVAVEEGKRLVIPRGVKKLQAATCCGAGVGGGGGG